MLYGIRAGSPELEQLAEHGLMKPPAMQGLTDEQIEELKLVDEFASKVRRAFLFANLQLGYLRERFARADGVLFSTPKNPILQCYPSGGSRENPDPIGRRTGRGA